MKLSSGLSRILYRLWFGASRRKKLVMSLLLLAAVLNILLLLPHSGSRLLGRLRRSGVNRILSSKSSRKSSNWEVGREAVREMLRHSWRQYSTFCASNFHGNELAPVTNSCSFRSDDIVGSGHLLTVVDALDSLALLELRQEFKEARDLIRRHFRLAKGASVSVFEVTIRLLGGFLGAFSLTEDPLFADKAVEVGEALRGAFVELPASGRAELGGGGGGGREGSVKLAEAGSLYLEFAYLSEVSGDIRYSRWARRNQARLMQAPNIDGVFPNHIGVGGEHLQAASGKYSIGGEADSFYEYLVKRCLFDRPAGASCRREFGRSLDGIMRHLTVRAGGFTCVGVMENSECDMEHLTCFAGGMFALAYTQNTNRRDWLEFAENVTSTCYSSYRHSPSGLGPETFAFDSVNKRLVATNDAYLLRPETVESLYYLYHITGKEKYRSWGWRVLQAINRTTRISGGFSGVADMSGDSRTFDNTQWSYFLAETLKYLYLLFSSSDTLPMDQWIFNTEAHILPSSANPLRGRLSRRRDRLSIRNNRLSINDDRLSMRSDRRRRKLDGDYGIDKF